MLEIAIVGAGICGLTLGRELAARGVSFALFEARERLGGRVLSVQNPTNGERLDLGPTWFWPDTQPAVSRLAEELGLERFDQYDPGSALLLSDPDEPPATRATPRLHAGAQRLKGGMASLVEGLAAAIPQEALRLGYVLREARDRGDHIELLFDAGGEVVTVAARRVVLAVPPRLLAEHVRFTPALPSADQAAMSATPTWMAAQAKAVVGFSGPPAWREAGHSGNAFVVHEQAVLGEVFDACDASGATAALGGFFALSAEMREAFRDGLPMLVASQFVQLFGKALESGEPRMQDWAKEKFTCAQADLDSSDAHPDYGSHRAAPITMGRQALSRRLGNGARGRRLYRRRDQRRHSHPRSIVQAARGFHDGDSAGSGLARSRQPEMPRTLRRMGGVETGADLRQLSPEAQLRALPWPEGAVDSARDAWRHGGGVHRRVGLSRRTAIQP